MKEIRPSGAGQQKPNKLLLHSFPKVNNKVLSNAVYTSTDSIIFVKKQINSSPISKHGDNLHHK